MLAHQRSLFVRTTLQAAAVALVAGTMTGVSLGQEKDPKTGQPAAVPGKVPSKPAVQPTAGGPKPAPVTTKVSGGQTVPPGKDAGKANPVPPPATAPVAHTPAPSSDTPPQVKETDFPPAPPGWYRFGPFSEPVDVSLLVEMVADKLKVQIISSDKVLAEKKIQLYTPVDVPEDRLLDFLGLVLEQNGQYIRKDPLGFYVIDVNGTPGGNSPNKENGLSTTQIVPTRGLKPTSLTQAIAQVLRGGPMAVGGGGQAAPAMNSQGASVVNNIAFMDDLGVLVITDTPRRIQAVKDLITQLSDEQINLAFTRFDVKNLSAAIAKQRMMELLGQSSRTGNNPYSANGQPEFNQPNIQPQGGAGAYGTSYSSSNLATRLVPDPQSNTLTLRGRPEEVELIQRLLTVVDVPNQLVPKWYAVGPAAQALAEQGKRAGLGDLTFMQSTRGGTGNQQNANNPNGGFYPDENGYPVQGGRFGQQSQITNGPVFVIDADQRGFMYYGTPEQHTQLDKLVKEFGEITQAERVVYEFYKLKFVDAEKVSDLIRGLINNTVPGGESPLLPGAANAGNRGIRNNTGAMNAAIQRAQAAAAAGGTGGGGGEDAIVANDDTFILPDKSNNQVVVKAPQRLQAQFARLINKLDLRRPQVYIDAKIVVVTNTEAFQLSVETQLINSGGSGGALRTLFPGSTQSSGNILTPPTVGSPSPTIGGIVAGVITSDMVPVVINALATSNSGRVVASPQLLVDDNEEATITSISQEPTTTQTANTSGGNPTVSFDHYEEAGPRLTVKPRLSTGDLLSIKYEVELSNFLDAGSNGIPPRKQTNNIKSDSVTLPSDSTIVVGGLELSQKSNNVLKIPLLGDIPIIGEAFKSTSDKDDRRTVYVFITPRIMRDPVGNDLRYISRKPAKNAGTESGLPPVHLELVEVHGGGSTWSPMPTGPGGLGGNNPVRPGAQPSPLPGEPMPPPVKPAPDSTPPMPPAPPAPSSPAAPESAPAAPAASQPAK
ncbi:MAG: secretin N-terminal domain-containing protein [Phycisphaerales bacterium]